MSDRSTNADGDETEATPEQLQVLSRITPNDGRTQAQEFTRRARGLYEGLVDETRVDYDGTGVKELDTKPRLWWGKAFISIAGLGLGGFLLWQGFYGGDVLLGLANLFFKIIGAVFLMIGVAVLGKNLLTWQAHRKAEAKGRADGFGLRIQYCDEGTDAMWTTAPPTHLQNWSKQVVTDPGEVQQKLDQFNGDTSRPEGVVQELKTMLTPDTSRPDPQTDLQIKQFSLSQEIPAARFEQGHSITDCAGADGTVAERTILDELILAGASYDSSVPAVLCINVKPYPYGRVDTDAVAETRRHEPIDHPIGIWQGIRFCINFVDMIIEGGDDNSTSDETSMNQQPDLPAHAHALKETDGNFIFESKIYLMSSARGTTQNQLARNIKDILSQATTSNVNINENETTIPAGSEDVTDILRVDTFDRELPTRSLADPTPGLVGEDLRLPVPDRVPSLPIRNHSRTLTLGPSEMASLLTMTGEEAVRGELATGGTNPPTPGSSTAATIEMDGPYLDDPFDGRGE